MADFYKKKYIQIEKLTGCGMKYLQETISQIPNKFWKYVLLSLINLNTKMVLSEGDILKSPLDYNNNIKKTVQAYI